MGKLILQIFWGFVLYGKNYIVQIFLGFVMYKESYMQHAGVYNWPLLCM